MAEPSCRCWQGCSFFQTGHNFSTIVFGLTANPLTQLKKENSPAAAGATGGHLLNLDRLLHRPASWADQPVLEYGAAVRLKIDRQLEVLPLDDGELLEQAKPITPDGKVQFDPARVEARHDAQVKAALVSGPFSFIILGGSHDLSVSVRSLGNGTTEYIRMTTKRYKEVADEK